MGDLYTTLQSSYTNSVLNGAQSKTKYVAVDAALYEGNWTGKFNDNKSFSVEVSNIVGYKAKVHFRTDTINEYREVLIKDNSFKIGDTKFKLARKGIAEVRNVVTDPVYNTTTLRQGYAKQNG